MNWQAKWIWAEGFSTTPNCYVYARREIELDAPSSAEAYVTCSTEYKLYANGRYIGRGPGPCDPRFQYYDTHDLSHVLRPGKNVIAAICYNYGVGTHCRPQAPGAFLLQLEVRRNGEKTVIGTDETWRAKPADDWDFSSTRMFWTTGFQEVYDSRNKPVGWNVVGFDDSFWGEPQIVGEAGCDPWTNIVPRQIPPLKESEQHARQVLNCGRIAPVDDAALDVASRMYAEATTADASAVRYAREILTPSGEAAVVGTGPDSFITLDFGAEVVGFPAIKIRGAGQATIDIGYSEALDANGSVWPTRQDILQADRLILHGGRQEWQTFGRRAFRYMQLTFRNLDAPVSVESVHLTRIGYPVEQVSTFECSDPLLNDIWRTGVYTLSVCMQDGYEDCPLREHGQYVGDARVQALMNYYCFFDSALAAKALEQFVQSQREDGLFNALWPSSTNHILPDYNLVWVMMLHDYYLHTADMGLVSQLYPNLQLLLDKWTPSQVGAATLRQAQDAARDNCLLMWEPKPDVPMQEWWLFIDHAPLDKRGEVAAYNAFYYQALRDASKLAGALSKPDDAANWHERANQVLRAFNDRFWSDAKGVYVDCCIDGAQSDSVSVHTNMLAILFGIAEGPNAARIDEYMRSSQPRVESAGPYFDFYVIRAMAKMGQANEALDLIRRNWGEMLRRGAMTWWETFDRSWGDGAICPDSLCHAWSGAPTYFLPAEILGVKPSLPGSGVTIQPRVGDLEWAKGHIKTIGGYVDVEWRSNSQLALHPELVEGSRASVASVSGFERSGNPETCRFVIDIEAPEGFIVGLPIQGFANPVIDEIDLSPETPERRARKTYGWGDTIWRDHEERVPYLDWLASQQTDPPRDYVHRERCFQSESYIWVRESISTHVRYEVREG